VPPDQQTFLFADLAGFVALTEAHGDEFAADAASDFCSGVRQLLPEYSAEEVKTLGDSVMVRVPDANDAVRLAVRIISEVGRRHGSLAVRVGVHTGTAISREGDWFGAAVNLSSRVADAAEPGEVLMTAATRDGAIAALAAFELEPRGQQSFRNVTAPTELFALTLAAQGDEARLPVDPVCRMAVDPVRSSARHTYRNVEYHFCSSECAEVFDLHPGRYTGPRPERSGGLDQADTKYRLRDGREV
jgi:class 3 adenylate cyclase/YHS domain-containing protein